MEDVINLIKTYITEEFMYGEQSEGLANDWSLLDNEILDSIRTIKLVNFLEQQFNIQFKAHEVAPENLDTVQDIAKIVIAKMQDK